METNNYQTNQFAPVWVISGLGVLLMVFVLLLIVQKANDLKNTISNTKPANTISVSAEGKVTATPDLAIVTIGVLSQGQNAQEVKDANNTKINKITDFVKHQGIDGKDITTSQFYFEPQQNYQNGQSNIVGYQGNQTITVKVRGIDKSQDNLSKILDGAVNAGANQIQGVNFSFNDPNARQQEARKQAIQNAKQKAQELAQEAGLSLGKVVSISESQTGYPGPIPYATDSAPMMAVGGMTKSVAPNVQPGSQDITATMSVTFEVK